MADRRMARLGWVGAALLAASACGGPSSPLGGADAGTQVENADGGGQNDAGTGPDAGQVCMACESYGEVARVGKVSSSVLDEISGLAASRAYPGVLYAHNDSGDSARFFAVEQGGSLLGTFNVTNASACDWEDMALGPCPTGTCVFLAEIGDNNDCVKNATYTIYRVEEPDLSSGSPVGTKSVSATAFPFKYPDGARHNSETLLVHPVTGDLYLVGKVSSGPSRVYRFPQPLTPGKVATLEQLAQLSYPEGAPETTSGDIHPCGDRVLLRTYTHVWELRADEEGFETAFLSSPVEVTAPSEQQGEAVSYLPDGLGWVSVGEGLNPVVNGATCQ